MAEKNTLDSPQGHLYSELDQWSTPIKLYKTSLLYEARSTSAFTGQFIPVQFPPQLVCGLAPQQHGLGRGWEWFSFSTSSQVQLEAADGPGPSPSYLRYSDPHNCRDRAPPLLVGLLWKVDRSLPPALWRSEQRHATFPLSLSPLSREHPAAFFKNPFYLLDTTVHFWCTFFSNSRELMAKKKKKNSFTSPQLFAWGALGPKEGVCWATALCTEPRGAAVLPSCHRSDPQHGCTFFLPVKPVLVSRKFDSLQCQKGKNLYFTVV